MALTKEEKAVRENVKEWDAEKGEQNDGGEKVTDAGHTFRDDVQELAADGDEFSQKITENWKRTPTDQR